jgi:hypothetical protein
LRKRDVNSVPYLHLMCICEQCSLYWFFSLGKKRLNVKDVFFLHCLEEIVYYFHQYVSPQTKEIYCYSILRNWLLFCESKVWSQGFVLAKQALYYLSHTSSPFFLVILEMGSWELFVWAGLELWSYQALPPKYRI